MTEQKKTRHIIYIPGFGGKYDTFRIHALKYWRKKNLTIEFLPMNWRDQNESYPQKLERVLEKINNAPDVAEVVLVGESAGGAMAIGVSGLCKDRVVRAITICGKNVRADRVSSRYYQTCPAFRETMQQADKVAKTITPDDKDRYATFHSVLDPVIFTVDTKLPYIRLRKLPAVGHLLTIFSVLYLTHSIITKEALR